MDNGISYEAIIHTPHCPEDFNTTFWDKFSDFELFLMVCALLMKEGEEKMIDKADTYCGKCIKADVCGMEDVYDPAMTFCASRVEGYTPEQVQDLIALNKKLSEERPHGECKTCKYYVPYRDQFSYENRGDGYCKSAITTSEGQAYINCHDKWYCANYEKEGEAE